MHLTVYLVAAIIAIYLVTRSLESFNPYLDYSRVYPGLFSWRYPFNASTRYYGDYWYIPVHEYMDFWMNGAIPSDYLNPPYTSESCVDKRFRETGDLNEASEYCTLRTECGSCPLRK